jgi:hypothetical protein
MHGFNTRRLYGTTRRYRRNIQRSAIWLRNYVAAIGWDEVDIHPSRGRAGRCKHGASSPTWYGEGPFTTGRFYGKADMTVMRCDYCHAITGISLTGTRCDTVVAMRSYRDGDGWPLNNRRLVTEAVIVPHIDGVSYEMGGYERNREVA